MEIRKTSKKKAISPILATVILIAITLVASVAIAGYVFGLFGSFSSTAQILISSSNCSAGTGKCVVYFSNTGTATATVSSVSINFGGLGYVPMSACTPAIVVPGGGSFSSTCVIASGTPVTGEPYTLSSTASNGGQPMGAGSFSA